MGRTRTLFTFAAAAVVPTLSHAGTVSNPSFICTNDPAAPSTLSSIDWGDFKSNSSIIIVAKTGAQTPGPAFGCSNGTPSAFIDGGDSFLIDFTPPTSPDGSEGWMAGAKLGEKDFTEDVAGAKMDVALFDVYLPYSTGVEQKITPENFLGVEFKWLEGEKQPGPIGFNVDSNGNLVLDPSIPPSGVTVSFYNSPQVPEPGALLLLGTGLAGLGGLLRKKRR